jgi:ribosome biogenesis protein MAK21
MMVFQGDTDKSVASKASHLILTLLQSHPAMKAVVIREVAALVLKPPAPPPVSASKHTKFDKKDAKKTVDPHKAAAEHARYYGIITLNQMTLSGKERDVAARLVEVYFEVFRELLGSNSTLDSEAKEEGADITQKVAGKVHNWQGRKKGTRNGKKRDEKKKEGEVEMGDAKLVAAVLTGVTRALPYARLEDEV